MKQTNLFFSINVKRYFLLIILIYFNIYTHGQTSNNNTQIEGHIKLDSIWNKKLYLSHISDFSKMYTMSRSMIIAESKVDSLGFFKFRTDFLPIENNLYRIHVSKKGSSEASIIIGGKDENHFFLIANKSSEIKILNDSKIFNNVTFIRDEKNKILSEIDDIVRLIDSTNFNSTKIKSDFVSNAFNEQLRQIADTCSYPLVSLYALHKSKFEQDIKNNTQFYQDFLDKQQNVNSVYFQNFKNKVPARKTLSGKNSYIVLISFIAFGLGFLLNTLLNRKKREKNNPIKTLSIQERKVYRLLKAGKSNKEISEELNIGVSTVKSHVSNIYSKLSVKSRKEAINFPL
ncbi:response regulator transcription factor [Winogradskyella ursingii]|uniref:response regulator transcription factor n=1 Tax=Winogradskyella ursingii TaxID=2686079 RepID=UPI0015C92487|nr:LuxR C-terminal-related transcriptional regulator [Winogradskyella ursingii]